MGWSDGCEDTCRYCDETEESGCSDDCLYKKACIVVNNIDSIKYEKVLETIVSVVESEYYTSRNMGIWNEACPLCDQEEHDNNCPKVAILSALGIYNEDNKEFVLMSLYTDEAETLFREAVRYCKDVKIEIKRLIKEENKRKAAAAIQDKLDRTCPHCKNVLKSVAGLEAHKLNNPTCLAIQKEKRETEHSA